MNSKAKCNAFYCKSCEFTTHYDYYGKKPPFSKEIILLEDAFVMKDPFSRERGFMVIGGHCSLCNAEVCCNQKCSLFYTRRFCIPCCMKHVDEFPAEVRQDLTKNGNTA